MSDTQANIRVNIETQQAQAQLTALQQQITLLQKSMAANAGKNLNLGLGNASSQLGALDGKIINVRDSMSALDRQLAGTSRSFGASFKTMSNVLRKTGTEWDLVKQRASAISAEYKKIGDGAKGMSSVLVSSGSAANQAAAQSAMQMQMFTRALDQAGTAALNWGKNMQWAGRQLMVGFTVPLTIFATIAVKAFQDVEREIVNLQRVYGDFSTSSAETERMTQSIKELSTEMANLGFTAKETIAIAADAAATGAVGQDLIDMTRNATELAALGMITQEQALDTIISMNSAFGVAADELGGVVDYLNAVENQTVLSLGDMTQAIPLVAPVVKGLGGDVKELAVVMTAMREGGIGANEAANALKTGLARLITPTKQAQETAGKFGINLRQIVAENEGDFLGMIEAMSQGLSNLSDLQQQQVLSDVFGKRQFARFGALFENFNKEGSQASRTMDLLGASAEDLARQTDKELGALEESETMKMAKAMEELKMAIAPIGRMVMEFITPLIEFGTKIFSLFDQMPEGFKKVVGGLAAAVGLVIPGVLMLVGLFANLAGNAMNAGKSLLNVLFGFKGAAKGAESLTLEQLEQQSAAMSLANAQNMVTNSLEMQERAVYDLVNAYNRLNVQQSQGGGGARPPMRFATGGKVPGAGNTDKIPALLTPGEFVVNKQQSQKHSGFLSALNNGSVKGFSQGGGTDKKQLTHTGGSIMVLRTDDPESDKKMTEYVKQRQAALDLAQQEKDADTEAGQRRIQYAEEELARAQEAAALWEESKLQASESGVPIRQEITSNAAARLDGPFNQKIRADKEGATYAEVAEQYGTNPDAYRGEAIHALEMGAEDSPEHKARLAKATENLAVAMEDEATARHLAADGLGGVMDPDENGQTPEGFETLQDIEDAAAQKAEATVAAELQSLKDRQAKGEAIDDAVIAEKQKQLEAQQEVTAALKASRTEIGDMRLGAMRKNIDGTDVVPNEDWAAEQVTVNSRSKGEQVVSRLRKDGGKTKVTFDSKTSSSGVRQIATSEGSSSVKAGGGRAYEGRDKKAERMMAELEAMPAEAQQVGADVDQGLAQGISQNNDAEIASDQKGIDVIDELKTSTGSRSPSRKAEQIGADIDKGLAQGILKSASVPREAAGQVAEQMALEFDQEFEGERVGAEQMDEVERGAKGNPPDAPPMDSDDTSQKQSFMRSKMGMAGMVGGQVISMAGMAAMAAEGEKVAGVSKELVGSFTMAAGQINSFAGMLPPMAQGIVAAGTLVAAGATYAIAKWREAVDEASREAARMGASLGGAADAAKRMADMFGQATLLEKKRQLQLSEEEKGRYEQFNPMFESEAGQKIIQEMSEQSSDQRYSSAADYVKNAIIQGFVEGAEAETFAKAFAEQIGEADLAESLAQDIREFNEVYETTTDKAIALAQKKMEAMEEDATLQRAKKQMASGQELSYQDASRVLGSSMAGIQSWSTVLEAAKNDYQDGRISFQQLKETTEQVTSAQSRLAEVLQYSIENNTDGGGVEQALKDQLMALGYGEDESGSVKDDVKKMSAEKNQEKIDEERQRYADEQREFWEKRQPKPDGWDDGTYNNWIQDKVDTSLRSWEPSLGKQLEEDLSKDTEEKVSEAIGNIAIAVSEGMPLGQAKELAAEIMDSTSATAQAYTDAMETSGDQMRAMQVAIAAQRIDMDKTNPMNSDESLRGRYLDQVGSSLYGDSMGNITISMDADQLDRTLGSFEAAEAYDRQTPSHLRSETATRTDLETLLNNNVDTLGPELTALLAPYAAEGLEEGMEEGGLSGVKQLKDILGGDMEAFETYIRVALADDGLDENEIERIIANLVYANTRIPKELQIAIGFDIKDPDGKTMPAEEWKKLIDETAVMANMVQGIEDGDEKEFAIQFAFQDGVKRKNISSAKFRSQFQEVMDMVDELDGADFDTQRTLMIDIITKMNDGPIDPNEVEKAMDKLKATFGEGGVANIPSTILTKVVDMQVDASAMAEKGRELRRLLLAAGLKENHPEVQKAQEMIDAAAALNQEALDTAAPHVWGSPDSGGGGGGGGDKEFDEGFKGNYDPKKNWKPYKDREKSMQEEIIGYTELIRRTTSLTEEQIEALKENDKAFKAWKDARGNQDKMDKFERDYFKGEYSEPGKSPAQENANNTRQIVTENKKAERAQRKMNNQNVDYFTQQQLLNDPELMAQYMAGGKVGADALNQATERAMAETTVLDVLERQYEVRNQQLDLQQQQAELAIMQAEYAAEDAVLGAAGTDRATLDQRNAEIASETAVIQKTMIAPIQHQIKLEQDKIKVKQRGMKIYEDEIKLLKKEVDSRQRMLEDQKRALELKMRENEMLSHDLTLMGYQEEDINEAYDKRIEALEKVLSINEAIAAQQQSQIGLADALSRGDIGAAAKAAAEMQQLQAQQAADAYKAQMETNKESAINSLTGQDSGMTREQIEDRQRQLTEEEYQTNLRLRDLEDEIYNYNRLIRNEQDQINIIKDQIEDHNQQIKDYEYQIFEIEVEHLRNLQAEQIANDGLLAQADHAVTLAAREEKIQLAKFERSRTLETAIQDLQLAGLEILEQQGRLHSYNFDMLKVQTKQAKKYWDYMTKGASDVGKIEMPKMVSPDWEANYEKYRAASKKAFDTADMTATDISDLAKITPRFAAVSATGAVPNNAVNGIIGNTTINNMNNNVNVNAQGANANEVADIVIQRLALARLQNTGGPT